MECRWVIMMNACGIARRKGAENGKKCTAMCFVKGKMVCECM